MKTCKIARLALTAAVTIMLSGCTTAPNPLEIKEVPDDAQKIITIDFSGQSGTFTNGNIEVSGNGYIVLDVKLQSGSLKSLAVKDAVADKTVYEIKKPQTAVYDSQFHEYLADSEYKLSFADAKKLDGTVDVYFVKE